MKIALKIALILGMISISLFFAGIYLIHMENLFPPQPISWRFFYDPREGTVLGAFWLLGTFLSILLLVVLGIILGVQKFTSAPRPPAFP